MTKFDNYVYLTICEISVECFKNTKFATYINYCRTISKSLETPPLDKREMGDVMKMVFELDLIYNFDTDTAVKYIKNYFASDRCLDFERCVYLMRRDYPFSYL